MGDAGVHDHRIELREALPLLELGIELSAPLTGQGGLGSRAVAEWSARGVVRVSSPDRADLVGGATEDGGAPEDAGVDDPWSRAGVALERRDLDAGVVELVVATCTGLVIDLHRADEVVEVLESFVDYAHFLPLLDPDRPSGLSEDVDSRHAGRGPRLVLPNRIELAPDWRGLGGVGRLVVVRVLGWLATDTRLVALQPFPTQYANAGDVPGFTEAHEKVRQVWASVGFQPWRHDIWCVDPASRELAQATDRLEKRLGATED